MRLPRFRFTVRRMMVVVAAAGFAALMIVAVASVRTMDHKSRSADNLKRIGIAIHDHLAEHEKYPVPIRSKDGTPALSWRVSLLPYLGERALYDEFHLEEPWDGPHNQRLLDRMPDVFALPGSRPAGGMTFYRSFSGPGALFDPANGEAPTRTSFTDGASQTLALVEAREAVPWTRPDSEIPIDNEGERASDFLRRQIGGHFAGGANVLYVDGSVSFLEATVSGLTLKSIITKNVGDIVDASDTSDGTKAETDFLPHKSLFAAIKQADRLLLYEGLPHQGYEQDLLEGEKRLKATVMIHGFPFYRTPLGVSGRDQEALKALLEDEKSFRQWRGEKLCGGFHPDYLAEWRVGEASYQILICLGCHEVKAFGPGRSLRCDIERRAFTKIHDLISRYRKNRPTRVAT